MTDSPADESDNTSEASAVSFYGADLDPQFKEKFGGEMQDLVDSLLEKRSMIGSNERAKCYVRIASMLAKSVWKDWTCDNMETLRHVFCDSIRRGDKDEKR